MFCAQECNGAEATNTINAALPDWHHINDRIGDNDVWIAPHQTPLEPEFWDLRGDGHRHATVVPLANEPTVVNVHLPAGEEAPRVAAAKELVRRLKKIDGPVLLTGDFNNVSFKAGKPRALLRAAGVRFMRDQTTATGTNLPSHHAFGKNKPGDGWIDDIGTTNGLTITAGGLIDVGQTLSDHYPLTATTS